jgi:hypothetical protein
MGVSFCIPACAYLMFKYHDNNFKSSQEYILSLMVANSPDHQPSFGAMVNYVQPAFPNFLIKQLCPKDYVEWEKNIKKEIDDNSPIAIVTRVSANGVHIRLVIGYDDNNSKFALFNPGVARISHNMNVIKLVPGLTIILQSFVEDYKYQEAQSDFNLSRSATDQLIIRPV